MTKIWSKVTQKNFIYIFYFVEKHINSSDHQEGEYFSSCLRFCPQASGSGNRQQKSPLDSAVGLKSKLDGVGSVDNRPSTD